MKFILTKWSLKELYDTYKKGNINLSPPYQRNFIWTIDDQQILIDSIKKNKPIPTFFLLLVGDNKYEMVDGQQRSRTIISFISEGFKDLSGNFFNDFDHTNFLKFEIPVTIITNKEGESIEKFYALVNKTGIHLNKPEVRKADYYNTNLLKLVNEIANSSSFNSMKLFTQSSLNRMNDIEFISELIVLIKKGHVDKKTLLDDYFKTDLRSDECNEIKIKFFAIIDKINNLNKIYPISKSRYKQRNDFYTLVDFILNHQQISNETLKYFYKILILISPDIKPTQDECEPLKEYARNCVTQSNSKTARENRLIFMENLFLNNLKKANSTQSKIMKFYKLDVNSLKVVDSFQTLDVSLLSKLKKNIEFQA
jgi:uncharacterized protein with ParB-like and HNH nuclease domain